MDSTILSCCLNQDGSCVVFGTLHGIRVVSLDQRRTLFVHNCGAVKIVEMLFCTSLLAYVGAGEQPQLSPRRLALLNTQTMTLIKTIMCPTSIKAVKMNRRRLVVLLDTKCYVYELERLELLKELDLTVNSQGLCALSVTDNPCLLALPASDEIGTFRLYDLLINGGNLLIEIEAHKASISVCRFSGDSSMIATASRRGTLIHVFSVPHGEKLHTLRRGSTPSTILSLDFSVTNNQPSLLAAAGDHGTVHVFELGAQKAMDFVSSAVEMLQSVVPLSVGEYFDAPRSAVVIPISSMEIGLIAFSSVLDNDNVSGPNREADDTVCISTDQIVLRVVTFDGILSEYVIRGNDQTLRKAVTEQRIGLGVGLINSCKATKTGEYKIMES